MAFSLTSAGLLAYLTLEERDDLGATLIEPGQDDPVATAIETALGEIRLFTDPNILGDGVLRHFWTVLAICRLYPRIKNNKAVPDRWASERDYVRKQLVAIRDGKFTHLAADPALVAQAGTVFGSMTRMDFATASSP